MFNSQLLHSPDIDLMNNYFLYDEIKKNSEAIILILKNQRQNRDTQTSLVSNVY